MNKDKKAQHAIEETEEKEITDKSMPTAGPHAEEHLTDKSKTPGTGVLPEKGEESISPGSG